MKDIKKEKIQRILDLRAALEHAKKFIEYARYELEPGPPVVGTQFPTQVCADKEVESIDAVLALDDEG